MLQHCFTFLLFSNIFTIVLSRYDDLDKHVVTSKTYVLWKKAVVPFYVNPAHFDHEQTAAILSALSMFAFKTCIKFKPVMSRPEPTDEVMVFINPEGTKRCHFATRGHSVFNPHFVKLGYECLKSPFIDMMIMKALGFPFEHNRDTRDLYIEVLNENIEPGHTELFTKEDVLPLELRFLPYDVNSVLHFGNRDYSKNGHRTIIFKDPNVKQNRAGLTDTDVKKIEIVYGPECRARDRQEKIELCQSYPGVARKKRQTDDNALGDREPTFSREKRGVDSMTSKSLRVNPDITPPPLDKPEDITKALKELGIDEAVEEIVEQVYKVSSIALKNARAKYCNGTKDKPEDVKVAREGEDIKARNSSDILGIIEVVAGFAKGMVDHAIQNLTKFCENSEGLEVYQRYQCGFSGNDPRCNGSPFKSTKSGPPAYSTQHRPIIPQSTFHQGGWKGHKNYGRQGNATQGDDEPTTKPARRKRELETTTKPDDKVTTTPTNPTTEILTKAAEVTTPTEVGSEAKENSESKQKMVEKKETPNKDKKQTTIDDSKANSTGGSKEKAIDVKDDTKAKNGEQVLVNNKDLLRKGTGFPSVDRHRHSRRSQGNYSEQPNIKDIEHLDKLDTKMAKKMIEKKHLLQKKYRNEQRLEKKIEAVQIPITRIEEAKIDKIVDKDRIGSNSGEIHHRLIDDDTGRIKENTRRHERHHRKKKRKHIKHKAPLRQVKNTESDNSEDNAKHNLAESSKEEFEKEEPERMVKDIRRPVIKETAPDESGSEENVKTNESENEEEVKMKESENEEEERPQISRPRKKPRLTEYAAHQLPRTVPLSPKNKEFYGERRWPRGDLVYLIQVDTTYDLSDMQGRLAEVNDILKEKTCVRMKEIKHTEANKYDDYIVIDNSPDYVTGRVGGKQRFGSIELFRGGQHRQHAAMMVMAMLGFYFEVSRHDRDKHIRVHMRHVRPDKLHHFEMIRSDATLPLPYDYASATHPAWQFWRQMGRTGISTVATYKEKDPDGTIMKSLGQNENILSDLDIVKINSVYGVQCFKRRLQRTKHQERSRLNNGSLPAAVHLVVK